MQKALTSATNPELHLFEKINSLFKGKRKVIEVDFRINMDISFVNEHYIRRSKNSDFVPKMNIMSGANLGDLRKLLSEFGRTGFVFGARKFNTLIRKRSDDSCFETIIGFVPEAAPYDKTFIESIPKGYFSFYEEVYDPGTMHFANTITHLFISSNYDWLEAVVCRDLKRRDRYFEMIKGKPGLLQKREVPKSNKYSIVKSRVKVKE